MCRGQPVSDLLGELVQLLRGSATPTQWACSMCRGRPSANRIGRRAGSKAPVRQRWLCRWFQPAARRRCALGSGRTWIVTVREIPPCRRSQSSERRLVSRGRRAPGLVKVTAMAAVSEGLLLSLPTLGILEGYEMVLRGGGSLACLLGILGRRGPSARNTGWEQKPRVKISGGYSARVRKKLSFWQK